MKYALKNVHSNPFRDMTRYVPNPDKITSLKKSIEDTSFWDNIVARKKGRHEIEIAYGHHRLIALRELYGPEEKFDFIVRDLTDEEMLKIMAHENMEEWGSVSDVERETVRATVQAFADGRIALMPVAKKSKQSQNRCAPSFIQGCVVGETAHHHYNAITVGNFLGWDAQKVARILQALELIELGHIKETQMAGMTTEEARRFVMEVSKSVDQARRIKAAAERDAKLAEKPAMKKHIINESAKRAKAIVSTTSRVAATAIKNQLSPAEVKREASAARNMMDEKEKQVAEINDVALHLARRIDAFLALEPDTATGYKLNEILKYKKHISDVNLQNIDAALERLVIKANNYRSKIS